MPYFKHPLTDELFFFEERDVKRGVVPHDLVPADDAEVLQLFDKEQERVTTETERGWRNCELNRADIELLKVQDGVGTGTVAAWRSYRVALRDWPASEFFPDAEQRPVAPDA